MPRRKFYQYENIIGPGTGPKYENAVHEVENYLRQNGRKISTRTGFGWEAFNWKFGDALVRTYGDENNIWKVEVCTTGLTAERILEIKGVLRRAAGFKT